MLLNRNALQADTVFEFLAAKFKASSALVDTTSQTATADARIYSPQTEHYRTWKPQEGQSPAVEKGLLESGALDQALDPDVRAEIIKRIESLHSGSAAVVQEYSGPVFTLEDKNDHWALKAVDLRELLKRKNQGEALGTRNEAAEIFAATSEQGDEKHCLVLPNIHLGKPITEVSPGALSGIRCRNIKLAQLLVPEGYTSIAAGALERLSVEEIVLPQSLEYLGRQDFKLKNQDTRAPHLTMSVHPANEHYKVCEGSLYSADMSKLLFCALPYPEILEIPAGVQEVAPGAFVEGIPGPVLVMCPDSLEKVKSKPKPDLLWERQTLWQLDKKSSLAAQLDSLRPLSVSRDAFIYQECVYDDYSDHAGQGLELASTPRACEKLAIPPLLNGKPVIHIRENALPRRITALDLPEHLRSIGKDNICIGLASLSLPKTLEHLGESSFRSRAFDYLIHIPQGLKSIGRGCFENSLVCFDAADLVAQISPNLWWSSFVEEPLSYSYQDRTIDLPFDLAAYDDYLLSEKHVPNRIYAQIARLICPIALADTTRTELMNALDTQEEAVLQCLVRTAQVPWIVSLYDQAWLTEERSRELLHLLQQAKRNDCVLALMQKMKPGTQAQSAQARFEL